MVLDTAGDEVETAAARPGRREELAFLFNDHYTSLVRLALLLTSDRALAEDLTQEAFVRTWRAWHRIEKEGIRRSKIQILEALLRLRQVACHPGLVDRSRASEPASKLDVQLLVGKM